MVTFGFQNQPVLVLIWSPYPRIYLNVLMTEKCQFRYCVECSIDMFYEFDEIAARPYGLSNGND